MVREVAALNKSSIALELVKQQLHREEHSLISLLFWSAHKEIDLNAYAKVLHEITHKEGIFSPLRRERYIFSAILCSLFQEPEIVFEKVRIIEKEAIHFPGLHGSKHMMMTLFRALFDCDESDLSLSDKVKRVRKSHPMLVDGDLKPFLMMEGIDGPALDKAENLYHGLKAKDFSPGKNLLYMCLMLSTRPESVDALILGCETMKDHLLDMTIEFSVDTYVLMGYVYQVVDDISQLQAMKTYCQRWLPMLREKHAFEDMSPELLMFFAANRYWMNEHPSMTVEEKYRCILVFLQMVANIECEQSAITSV